MSVQRYDLELRHGGELVPDKSGMEPDSPYGGEWVRWDDYRELEKKLEAWEPTVKQAIRERYARGEDELIRLAGDIPLEYRP